MNICRLEDPLSHNLIALKIHQLWKYCPYFVIRPDCSLGIDNNGYYGWILTIVIFKAMI